MNVRNGRGAVLLLGAVLLGTALLCACPGLRGSGHVEYDGTGQRPDGDTQPDAPPPAPPAAPVEEESGG